MGPGGRQPWEGSALSEGGDLGGNPWVCVGIEGFCLGLALSRPWGNAAGLTSPWKARHASSHSPCDWVSVRLCEPGAGEKGGVGLEGKGGLGVWGRVLWPVDWPTQNFPRSLIGFL